MRCRPRSFVILALMIACGDGQGARIDAGHGEGICTEVAGDTCGPTEYCRFPSKICGSDDGVGACTARPTFCSDEYLPVCGCDGIVYANECQGRLAGVDLSAAGGCETPEGMFGCGKYFCFVDTSYCEVRLSGDTDVPDEMQCGSFPAACGDPPDCDCLVDEPCGAGCTDDEGELYLVCEPAGSSG